jgi:hypothetical protein
VFPLIVHEAMVTVPPKMMTPPPACFVAKRSQFSKRESGQAH